MQEDHCTCQLVQYVCNFQADIKVLQSLIVGIRPVQVKNGPPTVRTLRLATVQMLMQWFCTTAFPSDSLFFCFGHYLEMDFFLWAKRTEKEKESAWSSVKMRKYMAAILMVLLSFKIPASNLNCVH